MSLACSYQPSVSSGVWSRASKPAWHEVQSRRPCIESWKVSAETVRLFFSPLTSTVPRSGLAWHSRQRSLPPDGDGEGDGAGGHRHDRQNEAGGGQGHDDGSACAHSVVIPSASWHSTHICLGWHTMHERVPLAATGACDVAQSAG